jgi:tRNA 2-thiouridine synthesizing protein A
MLDARGYSCPMPVVMVQKAVKKDSSETLEVLVDNQCAVENVTRFAQNRGYEVEVKPEGSDFLLVLGKHDDRL